MSRKNLFWLPVIVLLVSLLPFAGAGSAAADSTFVVSPAHTHGWGFLAEGNPVASSGSFVHGPGSPPLGTGSARLTVADASGAELFGVAAYQGTYFRDITKLQYSTYRTSGAPALAIALQFNVDYDLADANTGWQGRLVYEPYQSGAVVTTGAWQTWNPLLGKWWASGNPGKTSCPQSAPCTWAQVLATWPNAGIGATSGAVLFKAGSGWGSFDGNVDAFTIGVNGDNTTYDFERRNKSSTCEDEDSKSEDNSSAHSADSDRDSASCKHRDDDREKRDQGDRGSRPDTDSGD